MSDKVIVESKLKSLSELRVASDFGDALNAKVIQLIKEAEVRAKSNQRSTIRAGDL